MRKSRLLCFLLVLAMLCSTLVACKTSCEHVYDNDCDTTCNECGESREVGAHVYDNDCDTTCNVCGATRTVGEHNNADENGKCDSCGTDVELPAKPCETHVDSAIDGICDTCGESYKTITVAEALALCAPTVTAERYYIRATVDTVSNSEYGEMTISDETGTIYVYGTYSFDGELKFPQIDSTPVKGDEVVLHCTLQKYNDKDEVQNARLVGFKHTPIDESQFTAMSVEDAREAEDGAPIILEGVVARITYANGRIPSGFILIDDTATIYVYGGDAAAAVEIGNKVKVAGIKDYWILDSETNNAAKFGYGGCNQLSDATLIENDGKTNEFPKTAITETTVKAIMDTPVTEDITTVVYKVTALVKKAPGSGFVNYYIDDLDGVTGSYVYTQCNGSDFGWLDEFDGKICTVYLTALNAKSTVSGCNWRFLPIQVIDEGYTFNTDNTPEFVVKYHGVTPFSPSYMINAKVELATLISSELLGFKDAALTYTSSDESVMAIEVVDGATVAVAKGAGNVTITVKGSYGGKDFSEDVEIEVENVVYYEGISVSEAIASADETEVIVRAIVGPSVVNKVGFYLIDETGAIPVQCSADMLDSISIGDEDAIKGIRRLSKEGGQVIIDSAVLLANYYGEHEYSTESFIKGKTLSEIVAIPDSTEATTNVFVVEVTITKIETPHYTNYSVGMNGNTITLYSSGASQYSWIADYATADGSRTVTIELALCDWNAKGLKGCILAIYNEDGTKTLNTLNFKK